MHDAAVELEAMPMEARRQIFLDDRLNLKENNHYQSISMRHGPAQKCQNAQKHGHGSKVKRRPEFCTPRAHPF